MDPIQETYALDEQATLTCLTNHIVSWAASAAENSAEIKCGAADTWAPEPLVDGFSDAVECVGEFFLLVLIYVRVFSSSV